MAGDITKRIHYFDHQFLRLQEFAAEQDYHIDRRRRHNLAFHSPGVADMPAGLKVDPKVGATKQVTIQPGWGVDEQGREMILSPPARDVTISRSGSGQVHLYIAYPEPEPLVDNSTDVGVAGTPTRVDEQAVLIQVPAEGTQPERARRLATVTVNGSGNITGIEDTRIAAGVATQNILPEAVTEEKLHSDAVTSVKIKSGAVGSGQLDADALTDAKFDGKIPYTHLRWTMKVFKDASGQPISLKSGGNEPSPPADSHRAVPIGPANVFRLVYVEAVEVGGTPASIAANDPIVLEWHHEIRSVGGSNTAHVVIRNPRSGAANTVKVNIHCLELTQVETVEVRV